MLVGAGVLVGTAVGAVVGVAVASPPQAATSIAISNAPKSPIINRVFYSPEFCLGMALDQTTN